MTFQLFFVSADNPNDVTGGGGCICSPDKQGDCVGPYAVFPGNDMENISSPHVVVGQRCAQALFEALGTEADFPDADVLDDEDITI